jgi:pyruvate dehydrogenase E1 component
VILAQTKKGYGMGHGGQGKMGAHQQKKLEDEALLSFRDRFALPVSDEDVTNIRFHKPSADSPEMKYLHAQRQALGGYLPTRMGKGPALPAPKLSALAKYLEGTHGREQSTTMVFVQVLSQLLRDADLGKHIVPIVADEARTFGMQALFRQVAIYSSVGQLYDPEDKDELLYYKEAKDGQILEEGISEAGAVASWIAAATSYSSHGVPMLPFYIFYSCFGFQRVGDLIWAAGDSRCRGFLLGATAGRTTLSGEGLQHEDGSSHLLFSTVPNCVAYDPCFGYELTVILQDGMRRMLEEQQDVFYYVTVMNENYVHPSMPERTEEGILRGMYRLRESAITKHGSRVQLLGSGTILREVLAASQLLEQDWGVAADVWSVTSFTELRREGLDVERHNRLRFDEQPRQTWVERCLAPTTGPILAASDYMRAVPDLIRPYVPTISSAPSQGGVAPFDGAQDRLAAGAVPGTARRYVTLGTDGFGRSDTRAALRSFFEVDRHSIAIAALKALADEGSIEGGAVKQAISKYGVDPQRPNPWET